MNSTDRFWVVEHDNCESEFLGKLNYMGDCWTGYGREQVCENSVDLKWALERILIEVKKFRLFKGLSEFEENFDFEEELRSRTGTIIYVQWNFWTRKEDFLTHLHMQTKKLKLTSTPLEHFAETDKCNSSQLHLN